MSSSGPEAIGRFQIIDHLGRGGFADVYSANDPSFDSIVAVKILRPDVAGDLEVRRRFRDEAVLLRRVQVERPCPNLVTVHEVGEWEARPYLVMTYCRGGTVAERLSSRPSAGLRERVELAESVGAGLYHALDALHGAGVIHRDVKPSNLLLGGTGKEAAGPGGLIDPGETVLLADLGLAKDLVASRSALSLGGGTVGYMAPEQRDPRWRPTPAADLFAATMVIAVILMGTRPEGAWQRRLIDLGVDPSVIDMIETGISADPVDRYQTAARWHDAVQTSLSRSRLGVSPAPAARTRSHADTLSGRTARWPRRVVAGAVAALIAAIGASAAIIVADGDGEALGSGAVDDTISSVSSGQAVDEPASSEVTDGSGENGTTVNETSASSPQLDTSSAERSGTDQSIDAVSLAGVLIDSDDLGAGAIVLDESSAESGADPDHPLASYDFCGTAPDLGGIGPGANRVLSTNLLASDSIVVSSASLAVSPEAAQGIASDIVAKAAACETYADGLTEVTVLSARETDAGGEIQVRFAGIDGQGLLYTVAVVVVGDVVATLETGSQHDHGRLEMLLLERVDALIPS